MVECSKCEEKSRPEPGFDLSRLELKPLGAEPIALGVNAFKFTLPISKKEVVFKLFTGADERTLSNDLEQMKKKGQSAVEPAISHRLWMHILQLGEETDRAKLMRQIQLMTPRDSRALRKYIADIEPGLNMTGTFDCKSCGETTDVDIPMSVDFFWPQE